MGELYIARNGIEALEILEHQSVDLIITDLLMPKLGGIELIKRVREYFSRSFAIIITTAHAETDYLLEAINLGVDGYILKPIEVEKLLQNMERTLLLKIQASELASKNLLLETISIFVGGGGRLRLSNISLSIAMKRIFLWLV
ncbi:MAG: response regulator [Wolinella sp.]